MLLRTVPYAPASAAQQVMRWSRGPLRHSSRLRSVGSTVPTSGSCARSHLGLLCRLLGLSAVSASAPLGAEACCAPASSVLPSAAVLAEADGSLQTAVVAGPCLDGLLACAPAAVTPVRSAQWYRAQQPQALTTSELQALASVPGCLLVLLVQGSLCAHLKLGQQAAREGPLCWPPRQLPAQLLLTALPLQLRLLRLAQCREGLQRQCWLQGRLQGRLQLLMLLQKSLLRLGLSCAGVAHQCWPPVQLPGGLLQAAARALLTLQLGVLAAPRALQLTVQAAAAGCLLLLRPDLAPRLLRLPGLLPGSWRCCCCCRRAGRWPAQRLHGWAGHWRLLKESPAEQLRWNWRAQHGRWPAAALRALCEPAGLSASRSA